MSDRLTGARVLVTGGAGYIGSHAVRALVRLGAAVDVYDSLELGHRAAVDDGATLIVGDVRDAQRVVQVARSRRYDACMHFAALALVGESVAQPERYRDYNVGGTRTLATALRDAGTGAFVLSSTCAIYGEHGDAPMHEELPQQPCNPYGRSKLDAEQLLVDLDGLAVARLRYFNASGAHPDGDIGEDHRNETHLIPLAIQAATGQRGALQIYGTDWPTRDGTCVRDYVHVVDLIEAHLAALRRLLDGGGGGAWNLGSGVGHTVLEVLHAVGGAVGAPVPAVPAARRAGDPVSLVARADKAHRELGWQVTRGLDEIVADAWRWHRGHPDGYGGASQAG